MITEMLKIVDVRNDMVLSLSIHNTTNCLFNEWSKRLNI